MRVVYKYPVDVAATIYTLKERLPPGSKALAVQVQRGVPCIWIEQEKNAPDDTKWWVTYEFFGTGYQVRSGGRYVGTVQLNDGDLVLHLYEYEGQ